MARVIEVHGFGFFVVKVEEGGPLPLRLALAPADLVAAEQAWGNVQVMVPYRSDFDPLAFERRPVEVEADGTARVAGLEAPALRGVALRAVLALANSFPGGLSRQALNVASGAGDARNALRDLVEAYPIWRAALRFPRQKGDYRAQALGYRIASYPDVIASMIELGAAALLPEDDVRAAVGNSEAFKHAG